MSCQRACSTCTWWSNLKPSLATGLRRPDGADPEMGICTFSPPVVVELAGMVMARFPEIRADRRCGHWADASAGGPDGGLGDVQDQGVVVPFRRLA